MNQDRTQPGQAHRAPGDQWTRDRFALDTVTIERRPHLARILGELYHAGPLEPDTTEAGAA